MGRYRLTQSDACFKLGRDSVLLARFCTLRPRWSVCDLGCGVGSLLLLLSQREEALAKKLAEMKRRKQRLVDPLQFEMSIQAEDLSGYVPSFGWELAPPSDKQKATLEKLGIEPNGIDNAGKAAKLLDRLGKRKAEGLATPKQIRRLEMYGFQHVGTWQFEAAKKMIDRIAANGWRGAPPGVNPQEYRPD